jgi:pimeloyl-ACP methyl ester carboxylesterase
LAADTRWVSVPARLLRRGRGDHRVHAARWEGADPQGTPLVAVHGLGGSHLNWGLVGGRLAALGTPWGPVWAPDLAGFGKTPLGTRRATIGDNLDLLVGFVRTVSAGRPVILLGNSMGGLLALLVAARAPELVAGLVLIDPAAPTRLSRRTDPQVVARFATFLTPGLGEAWLRRLARTTTPAEQARQTMALVLADAEAMDPVTFAAHADMIAQRRAMPHASRAFLQAARSLVSRLLVRQQAYWRDVDAVAAPALLVHGAADRLIGEDTVGRLARRRPDWRFSSHPELGHAPQLEAPDVFVAEVTDWLSEIAGQAVG